MKVGHYMRVFLLGLVLFGQNCAATTITYTASNIGGTSYAFNYKVTNDSLDRSIQQITIYFDPEHFTNVQLGDTQPSGWEDAFVVPSDPILLPGLSGFAFFDTFSPTGIGIGSTLGGFTLIADLIGEQ